MNLNNLEINKSEICRVCCSENDLFSLFNAENNSIVKKLRACADITVSKFVMT